MPPFSFSAVLPLLGVATVSPQATGRQVAGLLVAALAFHIFSYVTNDLVDLPLDRTQPRRAAYPLVKGTIRPPQALFIAWLQLPLAFLCTAWLQAHSRAYAAMGIGLALMAVYNLWGKRLPFPPLTDLVQGIAWGALLLYGAAAVDGRFTPLTWMIFAAVVVFIVLINGVNASLRDLVNDARHGVHTTALWMGARPINATHLFIPRRLRLYGLGLQTIFMGLLLLPLLVATLAVPPLALALLLLLGAAGLLLLLIFTRPGSTTRAVRRLGMGHIVAALLSLLLLLVWHIDAQGRLAILLAYTLPPLLGRGDRPQQASRATIAPAKK